MIYLLKQKNLAKSTIFLLLISVIFGLSSVQNVQADDYYKIKLRVQIVKNVNVSNETIEANVKRMNQIFLQCRIRFNLIEIVEVDGETDSPLGKATLRKKMNEGLKEGNYGGGAGITITNSINGDPNTSGNTEGGFPSSPLVTGTADGETWAHEMGHGFGATHGEADLDGDGQLDSFDADDDGQFNTGDDIKNLMWPFKDERTGNGLSESQCKKFRRVAKIIGSMELNADQAAAAGTWFFQKIFNVFYDSAIDVGMGVADLISGSTSSIEPFENTTIQWNVNGVFPANESVSMDFMLGYDADNDVGTGISFGNQSGIDVVMDLYLEGGNFLNSNRWLSIYDYNTDIGRDLNAIISTELYNESSSYETRAVIESTVAVSVVKVTLNTSDLGTILPQVPAVMAVIDGNRGTEDFANFTLHTSPEITPILMVDSAKIWSGYGLTIQGINFAQSSEVTLKIDDLPISSIISSATGEFTTIVTIPDLDMGTYYLEAIDTQNNLAVRIIDIILNPNPQTTSDTSVSPPPTTSNSVTTVPSFTTSIVTDDVQSEGSSSTDSLIIPIMSIFLGTTLVTIIHRSKR